MLKVFYKDRETNRLEKEEVFGRFFIEALYGMNLFAKSLAFLVLPLIATIPYFSKLYGKRQRSSKSRAKILPFVKKFNINISECTTSIDSFQSFNDFFIRKIKPQARPFVQDKNVVALPADGRYLIYPNLHTINNFYVKNQKFDLRKLVRDEQLFNLYKRGSMAIARLSPSDCHRFYFPCDCYPSEPRLINGSLYSISPIALKRFPNIFVENKRVYTQLQTERFKKILFIEIGATCVGSIKQTFTPHTFCTKGKEKGYFEFGGSSLILLFQPNAILFEQDLIDTSLQGIETKAKLGTSLGIATSKRKT